MDEHLDDAAAAGLLTEIGASVRDRRLAEVRDLQLLRRWAVLHADDPTAGPEGAWARTVGHVLVPVGGEGTPWVQDFCLGEVALARGTGVTATRNALADVLDLVHRLPLTWAVCESGAAEIWVARKVARLSRHLPADCVGVVDATVARIIAHEAGGRVIAVAEGKVVEAAPGLHQERVEAERARRYVGFSRTDEAGLRTVIARVQAGDAVWVRATVERVAEILAPQHPDTGADELRSIAFGWLARPAELLALLLEHTQTDDQPDDEPSRATALPADLLAAVREADLSALAPRSVLYVHLHQDTLRGRPGAARVEGIGAAGLAQLADLLGGTRVTVKPVLDLSDRVRTTAYEHPEPLKERVLLTTGGDCWPFATGTGRRMDFDHPTPYVDPGDGGPPGQTGTHNSGPLGRRHHRWKTHAGYQARQSGQGRYVWTTPHGLAFLVDHSGTRRIPHEDALAIRDAPAGCDVYLGEIPVELDLAPA